MEMNSIADAGRALISMTDLDTKITEMTEENSMKKGKYLLLLTSSLDKEESAYGPDSIVFTQMIQAAKNT